MTTSKSKFLTTCAATVLLAVALSACGGGGGSDPVTDADDMPDDDMMPDDGDGAMQHDQFVGEWSADWPGGGRTELQITEVASDGQVTGTFRHQQRGREPIVLEFSPDGSNTLALSSNGPTILGLTPYGTISVPIEDGTLRFSYEGFTFEFTLTEEETLQLTVEVDTDTQSITIVMNRQDDDSGGDMMPSDPPLPEAMANVIDLVANDSRQNEYGEYVSGWWWRSHEIGGQQAAVTGTYDGGGWVNVVVSHDENDQLQHNVGIFRMYPRQEADPWARPGRYINTQETPEQLEGGDEVHTFNTRSRAGIGVAADRAGRRLRQWRHSYCLCCNGRAAKRRVGGSIHERDERRRQHPAFGGTGPSGR